MLENRLRKLHNEEQRLQKQIKIAQKHSEFADQVKERRDTDAAIMNWHKNNLRDQEEKQRQVNYEKKKQNQQAIRAHQSHVLAKNASVRQNLRGASNDIKNEKHRQKYEEANMRIFKANESLAYRTNARQNSDIRRNAYNHSVTHNHNLMAVEAARTRELNEMRIAQLEQIEQ